jgi:hypothetical protein
MKGESACGNPGYDAASHMDPNLWVVRSEGPAAIGKPSAEVKKIRGGPFFYALDVGDGEYHRVLVLDGHVVVGRSLEIVGRYLRAIQFLTKQELKAGDLVSVLTSWGELPNGIQFLDSTLSGPRPEDKPGLRYGGGGTELILYMPEKIGGGGGLAPKRWFRLVLRVTPDYQLSWHWFVCKPPYTQWEPS